MVLLALSRLLAAQGHFLMCMGDHTSALDILKEVDVTLAQAAGTGADVDLAERAMVLANLGASHNRLGDHDLAVQYIETGLALARQAGDVRSEIVSLSTLAQIASEQGAFDQAKAYMDDVLSMARACDDRAHIALALATLGTTAWRWGDIEQADACLQESLMIYQELGNQRRIPRIINALGILSILQDRHEQAEEHWKQCVAMAQEMGDRQMEADTLNNLGYINHHHLDNLDKAEQYYQESLAIDQEIGHRHGTTSTSSNLGHLYVLKGEYTLSWTYLRQALSEATAIGVAPLTLDALVGVAQLRAETGQGELAVELLGVILNHPSVEVDSAQLAETILASLRETLPEEQVEAALERGRGLELGKVVAELLA
jgi:tetratricopeptide (TPR) repeat protein